MHTAGFAFCLCLAACLALVSGCGGGGSPTLPVLPMLTLTSADYGHTVTLRVRQSLIWSARANASVGYHWDSVMSPADGLGLTTSTVVDSPGLPGSGSTQYFTWQATRPGQVTVTLRRLFRGAVTEEDTFTVLVTG